MTDDYYSYEDWEIAQFITMLQRSQPRWYRDAGCHGQPNEWFFPGQGQAAYMARGQAFCRVCPVRKECFTFAMMNEDGEGIWGGCKPGVRSAYISAGIETANQEADEAEAAASALVEGVADENEALLAIADARKKAYDSAYAECIKIAWDEMIESED